MTKSASTTQKPRKQHTPEFFQEALKLAERIGVASAARKLNLYESQLYNWRSKQQQQLSSSDREHELTAENARLKRQQAEQLAIIQNGRDILREAPEMKYFLLKIIRLSSASKRCAACFGLPVAAGMPGTIGV